MRARVELQGYALMGHGGWYAEAYRAVCDAPEHGEPLLAPVLPATWMSSENPDAWIYARLDAVMHDHEHHGATWPPVPQTWAEVIGSSHP